MEKVIGVLVAVGIYVVVLIGGLYLSYRIGAAMITRGITNATCHVQMATK